MIGAAAFTRKIQHDVRETSTGWVVTMYFPDGKEHATAPNPKLVAALDDATQYINTNYPGKSL